MESGALSVMTCGTLEMLVLFANSLIMEEVSLSSKLYNLTSSKSQHSHSLSSSSVLSTAGTQFL